MAYFVIWLTSAKVSNHLDLSNYKMHINNSYSTPKSKEQIQWFGCAKIDFMIVCKFGFIIRNQNLNRSIVDVK